MKNFSIARGMRFVGVALCMGIGALTAGSAYAAVYEKITGTPINK